MENKLSDANRATFAGLGKLRAQGRYAIRQPHPGYSMPWGHPYAGLTKVTNRHGPKNECLGSCPFCKGTGVPRKIEYTCLPPPCCVAYLTPFKEDERPGYFTQDCACRGKGVVVPG